MIVEPLDLADDAVAVQVLDLQRAAYRIEADLIGSEAIPQLHEPLADLVAAPLRWLGIRDDGAVVAALAFTQSSESIDIDRLVVAPDSMRRGYGSALVAALDDGVPITVSTGTLNRPAHEFYARCGFLPVGESMPVPGLSITHFARRTDEP